MDLTDRIREDTVTALKGGDRQRAQALRMLIAELQRAAKENLGAEVDETAVLRRERRRRVEAAEAYRGAGRDDLAATEEGEARIVDSYLPAELSDEELAALVLGAVAESGATSPREMGKVMPLAMASVAGRADGGRVSAMVREQLGS